MRHSRSTRVAAITALSGGLAAAMLAPASAAPNTPGVTGPSTKTTPYVVPVADGVSIRSLLTVGDTVAGYKMVGIPDGLGLTAGNGTNTTLVMNHELNAGTGAVRAHGRQGSFVSKWTVNPKSGAVTGGEDLIKTVQYWNYGAGDYSGAASDFARFCSGTLSDPGIFRGSAGAGYDGQIYFANEEAGDNARTFGVSLDGAAVQLPRLGLASIENTVPALTRNDATVVVSNEDSGAGQIRVYAGTKQSSGTVFDKAGLTNGSLHVLSVAGATTDAAFRTTYGTATPAPVTFEEIAWNASGAAQNAEAAAKGISLNRIEDGHFDPNEPNDYYFITTDGGEGTGNEGGGGGLWRLSFTDVSNPSAGGTLTLLLNGTESINLQKPDNMAIDNSGNILIQEDPGNAAVVAKVAAYRISDGKTGVVAQFDPEQFTEGASKFITKDEESSGIIDVSSLWKKPNTFVFDAQVHEDSGDPETVEMGQLLVMTISDWSKVYS
jgi:hypothetical protein